MKKNIKKILVSIFVLIVALVMYIVTRGSYLEYKELGDKYLEIFKTNTIYQYSIMAINFVVTFFIMYFTNRGIKKGLKVFFDEEKKEMPELMNKSISLVIAIVSSVAVGIVFTPKVILYASNVSFEKTDLVFNLDISFYMFVEPLIKMILSYVMGIFIFLIVYSIVYYIFVFNRFFDGVDKETLKKSFLIKHILKNVRILSIVYAIYTLVGTLDIVFSGFITTSSKLQLTGAGLTDVTIKLWGNIILAIVIVVSVFLATSNIKKENKSGTIKNLLAIPAYMVCMFIVMFGFNVIFVNSNKYDKEKQYIERNIEYTKNAYGLEIDNEIIEYSGTITEKEVKDNTNLFNNTAIINKNLVLENLNKEQNEKGYYKYSTASIANINNELVYISPREISNSRRTFNSKTFEYTHGYGVILTSATSTNSDGELEIKQFDVNTPQIYYGLETNNIIAINDENKDEYDYTDNKGVEYTTTYKGNSGISLNFIDRIILGIKTGMPSLAFSGKITKESKILLNRNIVQRAKLALSGSNIIYDEEPYMVIDKNGDLYWILDAYTISENYPYSTYTTIQIGGERKRINYIRNSIKVIINSYDGKMRFYITDENDLIASMYKKMYPDLFEKKESKIPDDIAKNFVYPRFLYNVQASILEEYHNVKTEDLYRGDDSWKKASYIANQNNRTVTNTLDAYYTTIKQNNSEKIGLVQMYTPKGRQNLNSYLIGTVNEGKNALKIFKLSSDETILGLTQLENKIIEDEIISEETKNLNVIGSKVNKNMMIIPINNTLLYIEQIYQTKTIENEIPKLKKVIVASGNKMAVGNNLKEALKNIVSKFATNIDTYTTEDIDGLIQSIIKANNNLNQSMNSRDFELIGSDINKLQELIYLLEKERNNQKNEDNKITENVVEKAPNSIEE